MKSDLKDLWTLPKPHNPLPWNSYFHRGHLQVQKNILEVPFFIKWISDAQISDIWLVLGENIWIQGSLSNNINFWMNIKFLQGTDGSDEIWHCANHRILLQIANNQCFSEYFWALTCCAIKQICSRIYLASMPCVYLSISYMAKRGLLSSKGPGQALKQITDCRV